MGGVQSTTKSMYNGLTWRIENFSSKSEKFQSEIFDIGGHKWRLEMYPKGDPCANVVNCVTIYLYVADSATLPYGWSRHVKFGLTVVNQIDPKDSITKVAQREYNGKITGFGYGSMISLIELLNPSKGYLVDDVCLVKVHISTDTTFNLKSLIEMDKLSRSSLKVGKFTWRIENFSSTKDTVLRSDNFHLGDNKWRLSVYPKGYRTGYKFSVYVYVGDSETLPHGWSRYAHVRLTVVNQIDRKTSITKDFECEFNAKRISWGYSSFMSLSELLDPTRGYLVNDVCIIKVNISSSRTIETIELEDMDTFFTDLEPELERSSFVASHEEAMEALAKIDEALNMAPANFYDLGMISSLKKAFKVIYSFDCCSMLTIEQKTKLLAMEEKFKQLPERAVKAMHDKNLLTEKESVKLKLNHNLELSLIEFKESKAELKQAQQKIVALSEQVDEAQKNKVKILSKQKEIFKSSQEWKVQLDTLEREWRDYVAKTKVAEEQERIVEAEWCRMKDFVSSLKSKDLKGTN